MIRLVLYQLARAIESGRYPTMSSEKEKEWPPPPSEDSQGVGDEEAATVNERALIRKLDIRLLPAVTILYLLSFLDRANGRTRADIHDRQVRH